MFLPSHAINIHCLLLIKKIFFPFLFVFFLLPAFGQDSLVTRGHTSSWETFIAADVMKKIPRADYTRLNNGFLHNTQQDSINKKRLWLIAGVHAGLWTGSYIALNKTWYANYPRSSFHFFNDNDEWNQMDKLGHVWTAYNVGRVSSEMWEWTGLSRKKSVIFGGISAVAYQSIIEIQDGFSAEWGFSWGDMTANIVGAGAFIWQELGWKDQRIQIKMSYWPYDYPSELIGRRNQLFGKGFIERTLKDYNSQTYWISTNIKSFFPNSSLPRWLNIAVGYGSDGMLGGTENKWTDKQGNQFDRTDIPRTRRFFLSPDIDLTKIKTRSKLLKTIFFTFNILKVPAPAIELDGRGKFKFHPLYY